MRLKNGDIVTIDDKVFEVKSEQLIPIESLTSKIVTLKSLKQETSKEFTLHGNIGIQEEDKIKTAVYLGTRNLANRYYHELSDKTLVEIIVPKSEV